MKRKIFSMILVSAIGLTTVIPSPVFAFSNPSSWAVEEINQAKQEGFITDSVMENYQMNITRAQFCELLIRAYEKISGKTAEIGDVYFADTDNSEICKAANLGLVAGYGDDKFGPDDFVTREQIATMLVRMIEKSVPNMNINHHNRNHFNDEENISTWAVSSVNFVYDKGIMHGTGNHCINPKANTTCEQAALLVYRTVQEYMNDTNDSDDANDTNTLTQEEAQKKLEEWCGDLGTWVAGEENALMCDGIYECDGKEYYQFRLRGWVFDHATTLTWYVVSADGTEIFEGMCHSGHLDKW